MIPPWLTSFGSNGPGELASRQTCRRARNPRVGAISTSAPISRLNLEDGVQRYAVDGVDLASPAIFLTNWPSDG
jgi:hypothetical protein